MPEIFVSGRPIGRNHPPFVIAEAGINHNGELEKALEMVKVAKQAGADVIKFQTFKADEFIGDPNQQYSYLSQGKEITESMLSMFRRYELPRSAWFEIKAECDKQNIIFMSTPQNRTDLDLLLDVGISGIKVGSDDFTNIPLLRSYSETRLPLFLSCGMADLADIFRSLDTVGALDGYPTVLLLCTSQYPTHREDVNLRRLVPLQSAFPDLVIGFSDHTQGPLASSLAVALGASVFEKHFTLDHDLPGPDHWFSENPQELGVWVKQIHDSRLILGSHLIRPTLSEMKNKKEFSRVIIASRDIDIGGTLSFDNLTTKRMPGGRGLPPMMFDIIIGKTTERSYHCGDTIVL